jgi:hypothetical protein
MADFHLGRDGEELGVFPEHEIQEGLLTGRFLPTDLAWVEGMPDWCPLESMAEFVLPHRGSQEPPLSVAEPAEESGPPFENRAELGFLVSVVTTISLSRPCVAAAASARRFSSC